LIGTLRDLKHITQGFHSSKGVAKEVLLIWLVFEFGDTLLRRAMDTTPRWSKGFHANCELSVSQCPTRFI